MMSLTTFRIGVWTGVFAVSFFAWAALTMERDRWLMVVALAVFGASLAMLLWKKRQLVRENAQAWPWWAAGLVTVAAVASVKGLVTLVLG